MDIASVFNASVEYISKIKQMKRTIMDNKYESSYLLHKVNQLK